MTAVIHCGDVRDVLATLPDGSVQTCVTSPPYFALRDYGTATWDGGDAGCDHTPSRQERASRERSGLTGSMDYVAAQEHAYRAVCGKCGATRVDKQIGLEPTIAEYLAEMVAVFRGVRRVLRDDGTLWLNIGDSYATTGGRGEARMVELGRPSDAAITPASARGSAPGTKGRECLKSKDLMMIPARLALALQDDGWWVRSEIIWAKPNPMPESVQDRPTVAHEHIWLLTKQARYYYDADAIRDPAKYGRRDWTNADSVYRRASNLANVASKAGLESGTVSGGDPEAGRNARTVWDIATSGFSEAHFATFPLEIPRRAILAGTSERGACPACGASWRRVVERAASEPDLTQRSTAHYNTADRYGLANGGNGGFDVLAARMRAGENGTRTTGWQPTCRCDAGEPRPCVVLDPFSGAGTTGVVALRHGRDYIGIELSEEYSQMSARRIRGDAPLLNQVSIEHANPPASQDLPSILPSSDTTDTASLGSTTRGCGYSDGGRCDEPAAD